MYYFSGVQTSSYISELGLYKFFFTIIKRICIKKLKLKVLWDQIFKQMKNFIVISAIFFHICICICLDSNSGKFTYKQLVNQVFLQLIGVNAVNYNIYKLQH